jgi:hypothetical protein
MKSTDRYQARTGHFILFWGVPNEVHRRNPIGTSRLAILEFRPRGGRTSWRYATNGMSESIQPCSQGPVRTELFASTDTRQDWAIALLDAISRYPTQQDTYFGEYDTVEVGQPIDARRSPFTAVLLAPPGPHEQTAVGTISAVTSDAIQVHQVIGIYKDECKFVIEHGGRKLYNQLIKRGCTLSLDEVRRSVL